MNEMRLRTGEGLHVRSVLVEGPGPPVRKFDWDVHTPYGSAEGVEFSFRKAYRRARRELRRLRRDA